MSHRARLPALNSVDVYLNAADYNEIPGFTLDCRKGKKDISKIFNFDIYF